MFKLEKVVSDLYIDVVTPFGISYSGSAKSCTAPGIDGEFCILLNHAAMLSQIAIGEVKFKFNDKERFMAIAGGLLEVNNNIINIMVESAEWAEDIEIERAKAAEKRARERMEKKETTDIPRAEMALARALNRLRIASRS